MSNQPRWVNPERQALLLKLFQRTANRCLHGHYLCDDISHYINIHYRPYTIAKPIKQPCHDSHGNPIRDSKGNQLTITVYQPIKTHLAVKSFDVLYDVSMRELIHQWTLEDNDSYKAEYEIRHHLYQRHNPLRGRFSGIARDIWHDSQPLFYLEGYGISGLTFRPFAKVRIASTNTLLFIDISSVLNSLSRNKRHKLVRYGKVNGSLQDAIDSLVTLAVKNYLN